MRTRSIYYWLVAFLVGFLLSSSVVHAVENSSKKINSEIVQSSQTTSTTTDNPLSGEKSKTYTLLQMSGTDGFILRGASAAKVFFLPVLHEWDLDSVSLHFTLYKASLSNKTTTLTLLVNDNPVSSLELSGRINDKTPWDISIPISLLKGDTVNIRINSAANDYGYDCYNLANPNYWVYITGDSTVTYHYKPIPYTPDLSKFPYPFIKDPSLEKDYIVVGLPAEASLNNLEAAFYLGNALGRHQTWRGIKLIGKTIDHITEDEKKEANLIYVGTAKQLQLDKMNIPWPLKTNTNEEILDKDNKPINDQTGVILLVTSPWNPTHGILVVTGNSDIAVNNAALMLRDPNFSSAVLFPGYALIPQAPEIKVTNLDWTSTTLKNLGYENQAIYGNGENALNYNINLPDNKTLDHLALTLDYSISPFLATNESSTIILKVNDLPVGGRALDANKTTISHWKYVIPGNNFKPGANIITLNFNLKLKNMKCTPTDASLGWAMVYATTNLRAVFTEEKPLLDLGKFISLLNNKLIVAIPETNDYFKSDNFLQGILYLSNKLNKVTKVKFMKTESVTLSDAKKNNILFFGNPENNNVFDQYKTSFPFYFTNQKIQISSKILPYLAISEETPIALAQLLVSPFNADNTLLIISGLNNDGFRLGVDLLTDNKKTNLVNGNVALIYQNGTFTSIQSQRLAEYAKNKQTIHAIGNGVYITIISIISIILLILIIRYIRKKIVHHFGEK